MVISFSRGRVCILCSVYAGVQTLCFSQHSYAPVTCLIDYFIQANKTEEISAVAIYDTCTYVVRQFC
jgi:hypothetical protein